MKLSDYIDELTVGLPALKTKMAAIEATLAGSDTYSPSEWEQELKGLHGAHSVPAHIEMIVGAALRADDRGSVQRWAALLLAARSDGVTLYPQRR